MAAKITLPVEAIRRETFATADKLGLPINEALSLLDETASTRTVDEIVDRMLCLHVAAACAFGFDRAKAYAWLSKENLIDKLTALERHFIGEDTGNGDLFTAQIESIWALVWVTRMAQDLSVTADCDPLLVTRVPDPSTGEDSKLYRTWVRPRSALEIAAKCDLAICAHWGVRQAALCLPKNLGGWVSPEVLEARHRALEWLLSDQPWQEVPLDTRLGRDVAIHCAPPEDYATAESTTFPEFIRKQSLRIAFNLGYPTNPGLPFVALKNPKSKDEAVSRLLCLFALTARTKGIGLRKVRAWLKSEGLSKALTHDERIFLEWSRREPHPFVLYNMESIWTLAWALGLVEELNFGKDVANELVDLLPDIKNGENSTALRAKAALRHWDEILAVCDVADCIHWAVREANIKGSKQSGKCIPTHHGTSPRSQMAGLRRSVERGLAGWLSRRPPTARTTAPAPTTRSRPRPSR